VHRSTLKYRLNRIRQVSGYDLSLPDNQFNLQLATRAWADPAGDPPVLTSVVIRMGDVASRGTGHGGWESDCVRS